MYFFQFEPFICPWYILSNYSHTQNEIDRFFDDFMNPMELSDVNFALYINKIHYLNVTKRFDQSKVYIETLIEAFPCSIELWIELLLNPDLKQNIPEVNIREIIRSISLFYRFSNAQENQLEFIMNFSTHWYLICLKMKNNSFSIFSLRV